MTTPGEPFLNMFRRPADEGDDSVATRRPWGARPAPPAPPPPAVPTAPARPRVPRRPPGAVAEPARGLAYERSERGADLRSARRDARHGRPDIDAAETWTPYMGTLVCEFRARAVTAYLMMIERYVADRAESARIGSELGRARAAADRAARRAQEAQSTPPEPAEVPTSREQRISARRIARARAAHLARLEEAARTTGATLTRMESRAAEIAVTAQQAVAELRGEWDLLAGHALLRLHTYAVQLVRRHPDGDRMQAALLDLVEEQVAALRDGLEELLSDDAPVTPGASPADGALGPAAEAG